MLDDICSVRPARSTPAADADVGVFTRLVGLVDHASTEGWPAARRRRTYTINATSTITPTMPPITPPAIAPALEPEPEGPGRFVYCATMEPGLTRRNHVVGEFSTTDASDSFDTSKVTTSLLVGAASSMRRWPEAGGGGTGSTLNTNVFVRMLSETYENRDGGTDRMELNSPKKAVAMPDSSTSLPPYVMKSYTILRETVPMESVKSQGMLPQGRDKGTGVVLVQSAPLLTLELAHTTVRVDTPEVAPHWTEHSDHALAT